MTAAEQAARRALKRERNELQRSMTAGTVRYSGFDTMPSRMGFLRRLHHAGRNRDAAYRSTAARIGQLDRQLKGAA